MKTMGWKESGGQKPISPNDPEIIKIIGIGNVAMKDIEHYIFATVNGAIKQRIKLCGGRRIEIEISKIGAYIEKSYDCVLPKNWIDHVVKKYEEAGWIVITKQTLVAMGDYLIFSRTPPPTEIEKQQQREKRLRSDNAKK